MPKPIKWQQEPWRVKALPRPTTPAAWASVPQDELVSVRVADGQPTQITRRAGGVRIVPTPAEEALARRAARGDADAMQQVEGPPRRDERREG